MGSLDDLIVDEDELNEELMTETLAPYVRIGSNSGQPIFEQEFARLSAKKKVAVALLTLRAMYELDFRESDRIGPTKLADITGIAEGTVYPKVRELEDENLAKKEDGEYWVPPHNLQKVKNLINGERNE